MQSEIILGNTLPIRRIRQDEAALLVSFYNGLSSRSIRTFGPLGPSTDLAVCQGIVDDNVSGTKHDLVAVDDGKIVGWGFLWRTVPDSTPTFGLGVADAYQGRGLGTRLIRAVLDVARTLELPRVDLTVVQDNVVAWRLYEKHGFVRCGDFVGERTGLAHYRMTLSLVPAGD